VWAAWTAISFKPKTAAVVASTSVLTAENTRTGSASACAAKKAGSVRTVTCSFPATSAWMLGLAAKAAAACRYISW